MREFHTRQRERGCIIREGTGLRIEAFERGRYLCVYHVRRPNLRTLLPALPSQDAHSGQRCALSALPDTLAYHRRPCFVTWQSHEGWHM